MPGRIVLDTNGFVAAGFNPRSASARILDRVRGGDLELVWNEACRGETEQVLRRIPPLSWDDFAPLFREENRLGKEAAEDGLDCIPDPGDRKFAALARAANATLVTRDEDLLGCRERLEIRIVTAGEFLER